MKFCKPFWSKHNWLRYDKLIEQFFTGGFMAWQRCSKCKNIKFDWCDKYGPEETMASKNDVCRK